ncbi:MAG: peptidylprolyl isomerase [Anaerolineales bacterium]
MKSSSAAARAFLGGALAALFVGCSTGVASQPVATRLTASSTPRSLPTRLPTPPSATPELTLVLDPADHLIGPADAPVNLIAYLDLQCRYCASVALALREVQSFHPEDVALVYRPYPMADDQGNAMQAAQTLEASARAGAFLPMFDLLTENQSDWVDLSAEGFRVWAAAKAEGLGVDPDAFSQHLADPGILAVIENAVAKARQAGLPGSPVVYLNGNLFLPPPSVTNLEASVRLELLAAAQFESPPEMVIDPTLEYLARLRFGEDEMIIQLFAALSPQAVNSFVFLSQHGWYDGSPVQRVLPGVLFETGDPTGTGLGGPGYNFATEVDSRLGFDRAGRVAMTSVGPGTNGSQFFITLAPLAELDGSRTIFGQVLEGLEVASHWEARDPLADLLAPPPAVLYEVTIEVP